MFTTCPSEFDYHRPGTIGDALDLLESLDDARPLAGGHSLIPMMKTRLASARGARRPGRPRPLRDRARRRHAHDRGADDARRGRRVRPGPLHLPAARRSGGPIGDRQVRYRGTIGGSLAHADPGADYPTVVEALGAEITATSKSGERTIAADDFFTGIFTTALQPAELVTAVRVPVFTPGTGGAYLKHRHPASSYSVVGVAAVVRVEGGTCTHARVTIGGATGSPVNAGRRGTGAGRPEALVRRASPRPPRPPPGRSTIRSETSTPRASTASTSPRCLRGAR